MKPIDLLREYFVGRDLLSSPDGKPLKEETIIIDVEVYPSCDIIIHTDRNTYKFHPYQDIQLEYKHSPY